MTSQPDQSSRTEHRRLIDDIAAFILEQLEEPEHRNRPVGTVAIQRAQQALVLAEAVVSGIVVATTAIAADDSPKQVVVPHEAWTSWIQSCPPVQPAA